MQCEGRRFGKCVVTAPIQIAVDTMGLKSPANDSVEQRSIKRLMTVCGLDWRGAAWQPNIPSGRRPLGQSYRVVTMVYLPIRLQLLVSTTATNPPRHPNPVSKHPSMAEDKSPCTPQYRCTGHEKEGYGLSWSPLKEWHLIRLAFYSS